MKTSWAAMTEARALLAGLPIYVTIGSQDYQSQDRSRLTEIMDGLELLAKFRRGRSEIQRFLVMAQIASASHRLRVSTGYFPDRLRKISAMKHALIRDRPDLAGGDSVPGAVQAAAIGARATRSDVKARPMAFIVTAMAWHFGLPVATLYIKAGEAGARAQPAAKVRQGCYWLIKDLVPSRSIVQIGRHFSRDHTTVLHGVHAVNANTTLMKELRIVRARLLEHFPDAS